MTWPLNNQIYELDKHRRDRAVQQLKYEIGNDHKERHGQQYLRQQRGHKDAGGQGMTFHGNAGSISSQIPGEQDTQTREE
jgi:hypothetical protein